MPGHVTYDTSIFIAYKPASYPAGFLMSAVVAQELIAGAVDESESRRWQAAYQAYETEQRLIVPTTEDWLLTGKVLYWLAQGRRRKNKGKAPRLQPEAKQRMVLDALIATSARRLKATVITNNWDDFKAIQYYYDDLKIKRGDEFFAQASEPQTHCC